MTLHHPVLTSGLLSAAVAIALMAAVGLWVMRGPFNKLHYVAPVSLLSSVLIAVAVIVERPLTPSTVKVIVIAFLLFVSGPVTTHLTARAARHRRVRKLDIKREEAGTRS